MSDETKTSVVLAGLAVLFLALALAFRADLWGRVQPPAALAPVDEEFLDPAPVRMSATALIRTDGDTSGMACYSCHDEGKRLVLSYDEEDNVILPEDHEDIILRHGRNKRNNNCFNCHDPDNMEQLQTRDGSKLPIEESTLLCAGCHGPTYRDWEVGIHGRTTGYWDRTKGEAFRLECADCHNPHSPAFPQIAPAPGPNLLHPRPAHSETHGDH